MNVLTAYTLLAEVGPDLSRFRSAAAFAAWLGLCPDNDISGGKKLSAKTRHVINRAAGALRMAANALYKSHSWLGDFFRRMRAKLGAPKAITAAAHKLARITFHLVKTANLMTKAPSPHSNNKHASAPKQDSKRKPMPSDFSSFH